MPLPPHSDQHRFDTTHDLPATVLDDVAVAVATHTKNGRHDEAKAVLKKAAEARLSVSAIVGQARYLLVSGKV